MQKIIIVEDDEKVRDELEIFLNHNGYQAQSLKKFDNTIQDLLNENADLILLDINLPNVDGEYICKEIRKHSMVPIIMVTSRENEIDELLCMNYGADYYVTKPFNIQLLLAKIIAILRRKNMENAVFIERIEGKEFVLNIDKSTIEKGNDVIELTKMNLEF